MIRKLIVLLLSGTICLLGGISALAVKYNEAPMLRVKVAAGELPPLEERLPEEPLVVKAEEIGEYGGTFRDANQADFMGEYTLLLNLRENFLSLAEDFVTPIPNICKGWEWNEDVTELTFFLRKGMKWSDGQPFGADDCLFWWEDRLQNDSLSPGTESWEKIGGELMKLEKIDDYTIKWICATQYGMLVDVLANWGGAQGPLVLPKHYLKKFHPDYTPMEEIEKIMEKEGFDTWMNLFNTKRNCYDNPEVPTLHAWIIKNPLSDPIQIVERNPYYWAVDTEGNQLPYIDRFERIAVANKEALLLKFLAEELDWVKINFIGLENYPLVMEMREKGNYRMIWGEITANNIGSIYFNVSHNDPVLRKLFLDLRFRIALSVALDREEINQLLFHGLGTPSQVAPDAGYPYYGERPIFKIHTEYDPELANKLLDEIGLTERDEEGYRLRPDGKKMLLIVNPRKGWPIEGVEMVEMYKKYWGEVGIKIMNKPLPDSLLWARVTAADFDIFTKAFVAGGKLRPPTNMYMFPTTTHYNGALWTLWILTDGESGEEPPAMIKRLEEIRKEALAEADTEKRTALFVEAMLIHVENLLPIGIIQSGGGGIEKKFPEDAIAFCNEIKNIPDPFSGAIFEAKQSTWFIRREK